MKDINNEDKEVGARTSKSAATATTTIGKKITPDLAGGFKDYLPEDMIPRQKMFDTIKQTFETFGFLPLDTPSIEKEEILTGGDADFKMMMFKAGVAKSGGKIKAGAKNTNKEEGSTEDPAEEIADDPLALRFDLTVPLARVVAHYGDKIEKPFKRYQTGKVWRGEKPQAGRFREFVQFDADIVGTNRKSADAEIIALMYETMIALGISNFKIKINNRKILNGLPIFAGYNSKLNIDVLKSIDKLDKINWNDVAKELKTKGLSEDSIKKLKDFVELETASTQGSALTSSNSNETFAKLEKIMTGSPEALEGIKELEEICKNLKALGVPNKFWQIDLSVARGLGYYTGTVFETTLLDLPSIGSVFSGGRYDDLISRFGSAILPSVGASIGVDRLFAALEKLNLVKKERTNTKFLVLNFDESAEEYCQKIVSKLRADGIPAELYLGREIMIKTQLAYALKQEIPFVIIAGNDEATRNVLQIKDLNKKQQVEVSFDELISTARDLLK